LSANINTERAERLAEVSVERERINAMLSGSDINLDQLHELVTAYQSSDSDILLQIGAITTSINGLQSSLTALTIRVDTLVIEPI
jgi:sorbitol-specific phosphotransferase system component IIA